MMNSYATYRNLQSVLKGRVFYSILCGGGSTNVGLLSENRCNFNLTTSEGLLSNEGVVPLS